MPSPLWLQTVLRVQIAAIFEFVGAGAFVRLSRQAPDVRDGVFALASAAGEPKAHTS